MKIDYEYETTEERIRTYLQIPEIDRLRWLEELCAFTAMARQAPTTYSPGHSNTGAGEIRRLAKLRRS